MIVKYEVERQKRENESLVEKFKKISTPESSRSSSSSININKEEIIPSINLELLEPTPLIPISIKSTNSAQSNSNELNFIIFN